MISDAMQFGVLNDRLHMQNFWKLNKGLFQPFEFICAPSCYLSTNLHHCECCEVILH
jgi:hypothetical protein